MTRPGYKIPGAVEAKAIAAVKHHFRRKGFAVSNGRRGCDLVAVKRGREFPIEVKGRTGQWDFISLSAQETDLLRRNRNARLVHVLLHPLTLRLAWMEVLRYRDFKSVRPATYALKWNHSSAIKSRLKQIDKQMWAWKKQKHRRRV